MGKYVLLGRPLLEVTFRGHLNHLQRSPLHYPWSTAFKKVYNVWVSSSKPSCNTNLSSLLSSNIPTCINLPYLKYQSILQ